MLELFLIRGLPSSGKTTFALKLCASVVSADDYFYKTGEYLFDASKLHIAHRRCQERVEQQMAFETDIAVANTFTTWKEMKPYFELAHKYGYNVTTAIMESRHGNKNSHNVPIETVKAMKDRFSIELK